MAISEILDALKSQRDQLSRVIEILEGSSQSGHRRSVNDWRKRRRMSAEARAKIAASQRRRWAVIRVKKAASGGGAKKK